MFQLSPQDNTPGTIVQDQYLLWRLPEEERRNGDVVTHYTRMQQFEYSNRA